MVNEKLFTYKQKPENRKIFLFQNKQDVWFTISVFLHTYVDVYPRF